MLSEFYSEATRILAKIRPSATFLTIHFYTNAFAETADHSVCFHVNYENAVKRSKSLLEEYQPSLRDCIDKPYGVDHLKIAKEELLESYDMTLRGFNPWATSAHAYREIANEEGIVIPGIKLHMEQDIIHLWGFGMFKRILMPGKYPKDNRALKTIAKDDLRARTPLARFVQFKLTPGRFRKIVVENMTIREYDCIRDYHSRLAKINSK